jgi:hypothetical protein
MVMNKSTLRRVIMFDNEILYYHPIHQDHWFAPLYMGMPVYLDRGPLLTRHLDAIYRMMTGALNASPRSYAVRVDLRLPDDFAFSDTEVITRFFKALHRLLDAADEQKALEGKRVHPHRLQYCWVREWGVEGKPHYHVVLMFNRDRYRVLGSFAIDEGNLSARIKQAWAIALHRPLVDSARLVQFPKNAEYHLISNLISFEHDVKGFFYRLSYFAKADTKRFGIGQRSFGTSRSL